MSKFAKKLNILFLLFLVFTFLTPFVVSAQEGTAQEEIGRINYIPLSELPGVTDEGADTKNLGPFLKNIFNFLVGLAAILAVFVIALGGFMYISYDSFTKKTTGKEFISNAVWGLIIVLAAYIILYTINPDILDFNLNPSERDLPPQETGGTNVSGNAE